LIARQNAMTFVMVRATVRVTGLLYRRVRQHHARTTLHVDRCSSISPCVGSNRRGRNVAKVKFDAGRSVVRAKNLQIHR
jgi:hypothetical protein